MSAPARALRIEEHGARTAVDVRDALRLAGDGEIVVLEGALQRIGMLEPLRDLFLDGIADAVSHDAAARVRASGLERMHDTLDADQVAALLELLDARAARFAVPVSRSIVELSSSGGRRPYFICSRTWVRAHVPYALVERRPELLDSRHLTGHLLPAGLHRDAELTHPSGTISMWAAVGPARRTNSIELFDVARPVGEERTAAGDGARSVRPELEPGDVLLFDADRLHASVRNVSDETRVAIGTRVVVGRRLRYGPGTHWRPYSDARLLGTPLEPLATLQSRCSPAAWRRWRWRRAWEREQQRRAAQDAPAEGRT